MTLEKSLRRTSRGFQEALLRRPQFGLSHEFQHPEYAVERRSDFMAHVGQELRLGLNRSLQLDSPLLDSPLERCVQVTQFLLGSLLCGVTSCKGVGHLVERRSETTDFRRTIFEVSAGVIITIAPFGGDLEKTLDGTTDKFPAAGPSCVNRRQEAGENEPDSASSGAVYCRECFGF